MGLRHAGQRSAAAAAGRLDQYRTVSGDERVYLLELPEARGDTISARQHPGAAAHRAAANCLAEFLRSVL